MTWRVALIWGALLEALVVVILALYVFGVIPPSVFGGVHVARVAFVLHLPGSLMSLPTLLVATSLGLDLLQSLFAAAIIGGAFQVAFLAALAFHARRHPRISAAASLVLPAVLVVAILIVKVATPPPYPEGMDENRDRLVSMEEWKSFHAGHPRFYGGFDQSGYIPKGSADYYELEFKRVDCNRDSAMDAYEFNELHWNLRWCTSPDRPPRPWWK
jgi:hypothetical protein